MSEDLENGEITEDSPVERFAHPQDHYQEYYQEKYRESHYYKRPQGYYEYEYSRQGPYPEPRDFRNDRNSRPSRGYSRSNDYSTRHQGSPMGHGRGHSRGYNRSYAERSPAQNYYRPDLHNRNSYSVRNDRQSYHDRPDYSDSNYRGPPPASDKNINNYDDRGEYRQQRVNFNQRPDYPIRAENNYNNNRVYYNRFEYNDSYNSEKSGNNERNDTDNPSELKKRRLDNPQTDKLEVEPVVMAGKEDPLFVDLQILQEEEYKIRNEISRIAFEAIRFQGDVERYSNIFINEL